MVACESIAAAPVARSHGRWFATAKATPSDAAAAVAGLTPRDRAFVCAGSTMDVLIQGLPVLIESSAEAWAVRFDGELAVVWGVVPTNSVAGLVGYLWMLPTAVTHRRPRAFLAWARKALGEALRHWDQIEAFVAAEHRRDLRWAERLGATFGDPQPLGDVMVCRATMRQEAQCRP